MDILNEKKEEIRWMPHIDLDEEDMMPSAIPPEAELEVLYEDERVLVVNKPAGIASEPERWAREKASVAGGLVQLARERTEDDAQNAPLEFRPRLLHRLDKDTSGALAVAKDLETERCLRHAFEVGEVQFPRGRGGLPAQHGFLFGLPDVQDAKGLAAHRPQPHRAAVGRRQQACHPRRQG